MIFCSGKKRNKQPENNYCERSSSHLSQMQSWNKLHILLRGNKTASIFKDVPH